MLTILAALWPWLVVFGLCGGVIALVQYPLLNAIEPYTNWLMRLVTGRNSDA